MTGVSKIVAAIIAALALVAVSIAGLILLLVSSLASGIATAAAIAQICENGGNTRYGNVGSIENPSPEEVAAIIYGQVTGWGYGDWAAMMMIHSNNFEASFLNNAKGDCWATPNDDCSRGRTGSRGLYQQFPDAVPPELAWSGKPDPGHGNDYGMYNERNAWGPDGWAIRDPRMNPFQSSNMFILGKYPGNTQPVGGQGIYGLDNPDNPNYSLFKTDGMPTEQQAYDTMLHIQDFAGTPRERQSSRDKWKQSVEMFERIKSGEIPVPRFVPPMDFMEKYASDDVTKKYFAGGNPIVSTDGYTNGSFSTTRPSPSPGSLSSSSTATIFGDSITVLMMLWAVAPEVGERVSEVAVQGVEGAQVGPYVSYALNGITLSQVVNASGVVKGSASSFDAYTNVDEWREGLRSARGPIVVNLGTNDGRSFSASDAVKFMEMAGGKPVAWIVMPHNKKTMRPILERVALQFSNLTLVEVDPGEYSDGVHPTVTGAKALWEGIKAAIAGQSLSGGFSLTDCGLGGATPAGDLQQRAVGFAEAIVNNPAGYYAQDGRWAVGATPTLESMLKWQTWDCSALVGGAYYYASGGKITFPDMRSGGILYGGINGARLELVPWEEARPGDLFFENTGGTCSKCDPDMGHIGMLYEKNESSPIDSKIIHAFGGICSEPTCTGAAIGMGIDRMGPPQMGYWAPKDEALARTSPQNANASWAKWVQNPAEAWYGRIVFDAPLDTKPEEKPRD